MKRRSFLKTALSAGTVAITTPSTGVTQTLSVGDFVRLRLCPPGRTYVRRDIHRLLTQNPNHQTVQSYHNGVAAMKTLPMHFPTSWMYQANIHGTTIPSGSFPQGAPWDTCEHSAYHFLPWHRMQLFFFEKMIRLHSGDDTFAMPYWNYTKSGQRALPAPFRSPANAGNALYDGTRYGSINGGAALSASRVSTTSAMAATTFHGAGGFSGSLSGTPHGNVHVDVGGNMRSVSTAGQDPLFWVHHCNIDRLWEKWLSQGDGRANPLTDSAWMAAEFTFVDECGKFVTMVNSDVLDTIAQLNYTYDDPSGCVPLLIAQLPSHAFARASGLRELERLSLVGARVEKLDGSDNAIIAGKQTSNDKLTEMLGKVAERKAGSEERVLLVFEGLITQTHLNATMEAHVALAKPGGDLVSEPIFVGYINTFASEQAYQERMMKTMENAGRKHEMGVTSVFDVTEVVGKLAAGKGLEGLEIRPIVRVTPLGDEKSDKRLAVNREAQPEFRDVRIELRAPAHAD